MTSAFSTLPLNSALLDNLHSLGLNEMTEIQIQCLPAILSGKDVIGKAKTGSGKTVTFALGVLQKLNTSLYDVQALIMCPTRELAEQVAQEIRKLGRSQANMKVLTLCGGSPVGPQISSLNHGAHVVVGTPGRIMDHLLKGRLNLSRVATLVLDEADRMLDMGFEQEMNTVIKHVPTERQTLLFSATYPEQIKQISYKIQRNPLEVTVAATHDPNKIDQVFFEVEEAHRTKATAALLSEYQPESAIVFCNTKVACKDLQEHLAELGFTVAALHGDLEQKERNQVLIRFANKSLPVLVATDVAARGLDVKDVGAVINHQISFEAETHIHRIGRTGRAEAKGLALSLCSPEEMPLANAIEDYQQQKLKWKGIQAMRFHANRIVQPEFQTLCIDGGKKAKVRPGDILGALTKDAEVPGDDVGKINVTATHSFVAVKIRSVKRSLRQFSEGKIKGKKLKARRLT